MQPAIHDVLNVCHALAPEDNLTGKSQLRRVVAMLTKLVARNESISENPTVYQTAFEHEHEGMPEQSDATAFSVASRLLKHQTLEPADRGRSHRSDLHRQAKELQVEFNAEISI